MSKLFQAFLTGTFFTFILDFFLFLGVFENYIKLHEIGVYYNILFADHQNIFIFLFFIIIIGYLVIYVNNNKLSATFLGTLFFLVGLTLLPSIGQSVGETMLMKRDVTLTNTKHIFRGDIYYSGREKISFYDRDLDKIILLDKKELQ